MKVGGGCIMQCLRQHGAELSPTCDALLRWRTPAGKSPAAAGSTCELDVAVLRGHAAGRGALVYRLTGHSDELAPARKTALQTRPHEQAKPVLTIRSEVLAYRTPSAPWPRCASSAYSDMPSVGAPC